MDGFPMTKKFCAIIHFNLVLNIHVSDLQGKLLIL
jgi:hypothetical protein